MFTMFTSGTQLVLPQRFGVVNMAVNMGEHDGFVGFMFTVWREHGGYGQRRQTTANVFPVLE